MAAKFQRANAMLASLTPIQLPRPQPAQTQERKRRASPPPHPTTQPKAPAAASVSVAAHATVPAAGPRIQGYGARQHTHFPDFEEDPEEERRLIATFLAFAGICFVLMCALNRWSNGTWYGKRIVITPELAGKGPAPLLLGPGPISIPAYAAFTATVTAPSATAAAAAAPSAAAAATTEDA
jgi:hypothetical protein